MEYDIMEMMQMEKIISKIECLDCAGSCEHKDAVLVYAEASQAIAVNQYR